MIKRRSMGSCVMPTALPLGYVIVPEEPTEKMLDAGRESQSMGDEKLYRDDMRLKWKAMIEAVDRDILSKCP